MSLTCSAPPLPARARSTASGCSRISRRSSTALRRFDGRGALGIDASDGADAVVGLEVDDTHAPGVAPAGLDVDDALAGPPLQPVLVEGRPLAETPLGDGEDRDAFLHDVRGDDLVAVVELDALHAAGAPAHRAHLFLREPDDHAELGRDHDLTPAVGP